jgi:hypothetical protein
LKPNNPIILAGIRQKIVEKITPTAKKIVAKK